MDDGSTSPFLLKGPEFDSFALIDARMTIVRALGVLPTMTEADMDSLEQILSTMRAVNTDEVGAAATLDMPLDRRVAAALLRVYVYRWEEGGQEAASRLTGILDVRR